MNIEIEKYINKRYDRWLDYSTYHTNNAGLTEQAVDVLNEVMISLLNKDENKLLELLHRKKGQYCELDFYVLNMVKMNAQSDTAPYRSKNHINKMPIDINVDYSRIEIEDCRDEQTDKASEYLENFKDISRIIDRLDLSKLEKEVFTFAFTFGIPFSEIKIEGCTLKKLYESYSVVKYVLSTILFQEKKIRECPKTKTKIKVKGRVKSLISQYNLTKAD